MEGGRERETEVDNIWLEDSNRQQDSSHLMHLDSSLLAKLVAEWLTIQITHPLALRLHNTGIEVNSQLLPLSLHYKLSPFPVLSMKGAQEILCHAAVEVAVSLPQTKKDQKEQGT